MGAQSGQYLGKLCDLIMIKNKILTPPVPPTIPIPGSGWIWRPNLKLKAKAEEGTMLTVGWTGHYWQRS